MFFRYYDYEYLLNQKFQLVDVMNGILSKDGKELTQKNIYGNSLLSTLFSDQDDVIVDETYTIVKQIGDVIYSNNYSEKWVLFNKIRKTVNSHFDDKSNTFYQFLMFINFGFEDFFKDLNITNNILTNKEDKILIMHILLNVYKILLTFPNHVKNKGNQIDSVAAIKTKMNGRKLANKPVNYLSGDFDDDRLSDYTSANEVKVYIASIDSYFYLYKKFGVHDKTLYMIFEIYDYLELIIKNPKHPERIKNYINELLNTLGLICNKSFNIDIKNLF